MKLLYCSRDYSTHDLRFLRAFSHAGFEVAYVRWESDGVSYLDDPLPPGARWVSWAGGGAPRPVADAVQEFLPSFCDLIEKERPQLIHAGPVQTFGYLAALANASPTVLVSWGSDMLVDADRDKWFSSATKLAAGHCVGLTCDSRIVLRAVEAQRGGSLPAYWCAPWGPDRRARPSDDDAREDLRKRLGWQDAVIVISTRAWHPAYQVPALVDAFADAAARRPELRLILLGDGADAPAIDASIRQRGIESRITRPGTATVDEVHRWMAASDIYLSLVPSDGTSISLLEAMDHALPVVVRDNPGNAEWIVDGETGYLVDGTGRDVADRLVNIAAHRDQARRVGLAARNLVDARADWPAHAASLVAFYQAMARS